MGWLKNVFNWTINPIGQSLAEGAKALGVNSDLADNISTPFGGTWFKNVGNAFSNVSSKISSAFSNVKDEAPSIWDDITGQSAIDKQFEQNKALAKYQFDLQEELYNKYSSPEALMRQYKAAGLNPNLIYGSASSGQGNVPSYSSPSAPLNLSYFDKLDKALRMITSVLGVKNLVYQTTASREAAQQSYLKTLIDNESLKSKRRDNAVNSIIAGWFPSSQLPSRYNYVGGFWSDELDRYSEAIRNGKINSALSSALKNSYLYGKYHTPLYSDLLDGGLPEGISHPSAYYDISNKKWASKLREWDYDWNDEYKTMLKGAGVAAPIIQTLLRILGGK